MLGARRRARDGGALPETGRPATGRGSWAGTPDQVTLIADCKLVDAETIGQILDARMHFISLLPDNLDLRRATIEGTWEVEPDLSAWPLLLERPGKTKADPPERWTGFSAEHPFTVRRCGHDGKEVEQTRTLRFLVIHSTSAARRFEQGLADRMRAERETMEKAQARMTRQPFHCAEEATKAAEKLASALRFYTAAVETHRVERPVKRKGAGRPKKGEPVPTEVV